MWEWLRFAAPVARKVERNPPRTPVNSNTFYLGWAQNAPSPSLRSLVNRHAQKWENKFSLVWPSECRHPPSFCRVAGCSPPQGLWNALLTVPAEPRLTAKDIQQLMGSLGHPHGREQGKEASSVASFLRPTRYRGLNLRGRTSGEGEGIPGHHLRGRLRNERLSRIWTRLKLNHDAK